MEVINTNTNAAQTSASAPTTSGIGRSGTFWLPPKTADSFSSNLAKNSNCKSTATKNARTTVSNKTVETSPSRKANLQNSLKQAKESRLPEIKSNLETIVAKKNHTSSSSASKLKSSSVISHNSNIKASKSSFLPPNAPAVSKNPKVMKTIFEPQNSKESINPDGERREGKQKNHSRGTETAKHNSYMETAKISDDGLKAGKSNRDSTSTPQDSTKSFINLANKSIIPRIAYLSKNDKKVVRFAIDLPGGDKLGVRLEKQGKDFKLCFICPNKSTLNLLDFAKPSIAQAANGITQGGLKITVFSSYKEMDLYQEIAA